MSSMLRQKRTLSIIFSAGIFVGLAFFLLKDSMLKTGFFTAFIISLGSCALLLALIEYGTRFFIRIKLKKEVRHGDSARLSVFIREVHYSYTKREVVRAIRTFEKESGCVIVFSEHSSGVLYADWDRNKPVSVKKIEKRFSSKKNGIYFFNAQFNCCLKRFAHGFVLKSRNHFLFAFYPAVSKIHQLLIKNLYEVFGSFIYRAGIFETLSHTGLLAKEWSEIEKTQYSFLPKELPQTAGLEAAAYFLPLANVSGDYYTMLPVSNEKTLLLLGDVSGKGLAAALVMGVVINAVKAFDNRENLPGIVAYVDTAIKFMHLQEKFTVLFVGIVDTDKMELQYINASMADTFILRHGAENAEIRELHSNCPLLGIIDLSEISSETEKLVSGDMILISSDGVSETGYTSGVCFGDTELYRKTLREGVTMPPAAFVEHLANTAIKYGNNSRLRDDITILAVRVSAL